MISFDLASLISALSEALDAVEKELIGATTNHSRRVAYLCLHMSDPMGLSGEEKLALAGCAMLHDCALTEYIHNDMEGDMSRPLDLAPHCIVGEKNAEGIPFDPSFRGAVLYHHENADGSGVFGKKTAETPLFARLIHFADQVDVRFQLSHFSEEKRAKIDAYLNENCGTLFDPEVTALYRENITDKDIAAMSEENILSRLLDSFTIKQENFTPAELKHIAEIFAAIIDYKSPFTSSHSSGIAEKAARLAAYYHMDEEECAKMYFAGAVHDVGKLVICNDILEKPDRLTDEEFRTIQNHAYASYEILSKIDGLDEVASWAYLHHEKLDGSGYPFGYHADKLDRHARMLSCLDIYQALVESRPYKAGMEHEKALAILRSMAGEGKLDCGIVEDIALCFA